MKRKLFLAASGGMLLCGGAASGAASTALYEPIASNGDPLRSMFNRDVGKVRVVMLVSPT